MAKSFNPGRIVVTAGINQEMKKDRVFRTFVNLSLGRFMSGDWGDMEDEEKAVNEQAVQAGKGRIHGAYIRKSNNAKIWIITEADRSTTTILFPDEY